MRSPLLRCLAVILVNVGILAAIEGGSALLIRKHFNKANILFRHRSEVEHPFAVPGGYEMKANSVIGGPRGSTRIRTDARGRAIVPNALPAPRFTLGILGGSAMFGTGIADNAATVPAQVQTLLRRDHGIEVNVINLGARGYVSLQELLALNLCLAEERLDMVVSVSGYNDQARYIRGDFHPCYVVGPKSEAVALVRRVEAGNLVIANFGLALRRVSQTANLMALAMERREDRAREAQKKALAVRQTPNGAPPTPKHDRNAEETPGENLQPASRKPSSPSAAFLNAHLAHYAMMQAVCLAHHADFKLFFQPTAFTKANLSGQEKSRLLEKDGFGSQDKLNALTQAYNGYRAAFDALPKPFAYTDLAGAFGQTDETVYLDRCHFNAEGSTLLARVIAADLAPIIQARLAAQKPSP